MARRRPSPWKFEQPKLAGAAIAFVVLAIVGLPAAGAYVAAAIIAWAWPGMEEFEPESTGSKHAQASVDFKAHLWQPFGAKVWAAAPGSHGEQGTSWWPPLRVSAWLAGLTAVTWTVVWLLVVSIVSPLVGAGDTTADPGPTWPLVPAVLDGLFALLLFQALAAGARDAAHPSPNDGFPAAMATPDDVAAVRERLEVAPLLRSAAVAGVATAALTIGGLWRLAATTDLHINMLLAAAAGLLLGVTAAAAVAGRAYIREYNQPMRDHLALIEAWQMRWMMLKPAIDPGLFVSEHAQPPETTGMDETHRVAFFQVAPGRTIEDYRKYVDKLGSAIASSPGEAELVLVAPMPKTDPDTNQVIPGTRAEQMFSVTWNTSPLGERAHLASGFDNWTLKFAIHRAFDKAFVALNLGMADLVRVAPMHDPNSGSPYTLFETVWVLPAGVTFPKLVSKADAIAEKIDADWLRVGRRTKDSEGRTLADSHVSIVFGHHPDRVTLRDPSAKPWLEAMDLELAFNALKLGSPLLVETEQLSLRGHPDLIEARFQLSNEIDWGAVIKKTPAMAEKVDVDYLRVTRRHDPESGRASSLVSVIYGADPNSTVLISDRPGYEPAKPPVGVEHNPDRLFLDSTDWDLWFRSCKLVGTDGQSPPILTKEVNEQRVSTYRAKHVPGLSLDDLKDGIEALKATSGLGYVEIEADPDDASFFRIMAGKLDPLDKGYLAVDYMAEPKPGAPADLNWPVLHEPVKGIPDPNWVVGPGANGELLVDKWEGDNPHLFVGGACLSPDTLVQPEGSDPVPLADLVNPGHDRRLLIRSGMPDGQLGLAGSTHAGSVRRGHAYTVRFADGRHLTGSADHPLWTPTGWRGLATLRHGDLVATNHPDHGLLRASDARSGTVWQRVTGVRYEGVMDLYDLTVSWTHNYLANGVVAHNSGSGKSVAILWMLLQMMANNDPADVKFALADPKTELVFFEQAQHVNYFIGLNTPGFAANPFRALADLLGAMKDETYRRNTLFTQHPSKPQNLGQARFIARHEIEHARNGTIPNGWPVDEGIGFPWWDGEPDDHPFGLPFQFVVIEECSTFFKTPANKEHRPDWEEVIGHVEELARIARSAGIFLIAATQYPKKENIPTTLLAQCRRIGLPMNRIGSMLTIEEAGLEKLNTPGRGKMSYGKSYRGMRVLFVRVPDEKDPEVTDDRASIFGHVPLKSGARPTYSSMDTHAAGSNVAAGHGPSVVAAPPPDPSEVWGHGAPADDGDTDASEVA